MNQTNDTILQAIDIVVNARLNAIKRDSTIKAQIYSTAQAEKGIYSIKYQNAIFTAYNSNLSVSYNIDDNVYVTVINGDLGNDKYIVGKVIAKNKDNQYVETVDVNDYYQLIGPAFETLYQFEEDSINGLEIPAHKAILLNNNNELNQNCYAIIYNNTENDDKLLNYSKQYGYIQIAADFKYWPQNDVSKTGNYGLILHFIDANDQNLFSIFDTSLMYGTPYTPYDYTRRRVTLAAPFGTIKSLKGIYLFSEGFTRTKTETAIRDFKEIGVKNLTISFAEELDQSEPYVATILTPYGQTAQEANDLAKSLTLIGQLKYNNKPYTESYTCEWFQRNPSIGFSDTSYRTSGGIGWEYKHTGNEYHVLEQGFELENVQWVNQHIKLVITKDDITRLDDITIYKNFNQILNYKIKAIRNTSNEYVLQVVDEKGTVLLDNAYTYKWEYVDINNQIHSINSTVNKVVENADNILTDRLYRCILIKNSTVYAIVEYTITVNGESDEDFTVHFITESNGVFLYGENGQIEIESCLKSKELSFTIPNNSWRSGSPQPYTYRWILDGYNDTIANYDAGELKINYSPSTSMVTYLAGSVLTGSSDNIKPLYYKINRNFSSSKLNNSATLEINVNGIPYYFTFYFSFSKQGGMGTNGTNYQLVAEPKNNKSLVYNEGWKVKSISYNLTLYNNGIIEQFSDPTFELIKCQNIHGETKTNLSLSTLENAISCSWSQEILTVTVSDNIVASPNDYFCNIVKATVSAGGYKISTYIPIDILVGQNDNNENYNFYYYPTIVYNPQGYNPKYYTGNLNDFWDKQKEDEQPVSYAVKNDNTIFKIRQFDSDDDGVKEAYALIVNSTYESNLAYNSLVINLKNDSYLLHPLLAVVNQYGITGINEWVGNSIEINENKGYVYAAQLAAGSKNNKNQFTGVVMGNYASSDEQETDGQGLWGFQDGAASFGFNADGTAFIGKANSARLEFDGSTKGTIQSAGYIEGTKGLCLDFIAGTINAPSFMFKSATDKDESIFEFNLTSDKSSKFLIKADGTPIFKATGAEQQNEDEPKKQIYELQSVNYDANKTGLKIDLYDGSLISKDFTIKTGSNSAGGKFNFNIGDGNSSFIINAPYTDGNGQKSSKSIFKATDNSYYLESIDYSSDNSKGLRIDLENGSISSPKFKLTNAGDAYFTGDITGASGRFSGSVTITGDLTMGDTATINWNGKANFDDYATKDSLKDYVLSSSMSNYATKEDLAEIDLSDYVEKGSKIETVFGKNTYLRNDYLYSPTIIGSGMYAHYFQVIANEDDLDDGLQVVGGMGYGIGSSTLWDPTTGSTVYETTNGVMMCCTANNQLKNYVICTNAGVRLQSENVALFITEQGAFYRKGSAPAQEIGTAVTGQYAVFG